MCGISGCFCFGKIGAQKIEMKHSKVFGLIGYPITHSFSKKYFSKKFEEEGIQNCRYELFPLENINHLPALIDNQPFLKGLNVTIPYKQTVFPYLDEIDKAAVKVGAVNTIKKENGKFIPHGTGFLIYNYTPNGSSTLVTCEHVLRNKEIYVVIEADSSLIKLMNRLVP